MIILEILSFLFIMLYLIVLVFMGWKMYRFEDRITKAINEVVDQVNKINKIEYEVDYNQQQRLEALEKSTPTPASR
jgi:ABC-type lipoprotein release transport system permease subunit